MDRTTKITFIAQSKHKHEYGAKEAERKRTLVKMKLSDQQLNEIIREIVQKLVRESEIIANAYINGYR